MKLRTLEISVGIFVILGIVALLMLALQVSGLSDFYRDDIGYKVKAQFANIGGLKVRSKVTAAGVRIGRVTRIDLDPEEYLATVEMSIDPSVKTIPSDSKASILTAGLLGDNYIGIDPGFAEDYLAEGSLIDFTNTSSAVVLENLISKFVAGEASGSR